MVWADEWLRIYPACPEDRSLCSYSRSGLCEDDEDHEIPITKDLILHRCPWAEIGSDLPALNRVVTLHRHWKHGCLTALVPNPTEELMDLIAHYDQEVDAMRAELLSRRTNR